MSAIELLVAPAGRRTAPRLPRAAARLGQWAGDALDAVLAGVVKPALTPVLIGLRQRMVALRLRQAFDPDFYAYCYPEHVAGADPLAHYLTIGRRLGFDPCPDFSLVGYIGDYPEMAQAADDPFYLHLRAGRGQVRIARPSSRKVEYFTAKAFDAAYYLATYPDVRASGEDALAHYLATGWKQGRDPRPDFSTAFYLELYPDARDAGANPLHHYVTIGRAEARKTHPLTAPSCHFAVGAVSNDGAPHEDGAPGDAAASGDDAARGNDAALLRRLMRRQPAMATKWLSPNYLTTAFSESQRLSALLHNYQVLMQAAGPGLFHAILYDQYEVWRGGDEEAPYRIVLKLADPAINEGELSLEFHSTHERLYVLSFTLVDGALVGLAAGRTVMVSRLQGDGAKFDRIKAAAKALKDVAPGYMLLAALQGLASALGVTQFAGVASAFQVSGQGSVQASERFKDAYDHFFETVGAERTSLAFFTAPLPLPEKPLSEVKKGHRLRTKAKRQIKGQVTAAARRAVGLGLRQAAPLRPDDDVQEVEPHDRAANEDDGETLAKIAFEALDRAAA